MTSGTVCSRPTVGVILAGGRSRRYGSPKALARLGDRSVLELVIEAHRAVVDHVILVANDPVLYADYDVPRVPDEWLDAGPLGGVHAGLLQAARIGATGALITPCDVPFVGTAILNALLAARERADAVLAAGRGPHPYEPLVGWYSLSLLPLLEDALERNQLALHRLVERIEALYILPSDGLAEDVDLDRALLNVNTPRDLDTARALLASSQGRARGS